jgi:AAHS family 4-hydroxybenzoate transporter-like MFS transporter
MAQQTTVNIADVVENQENPWSGLFTFGTFAMCCLVMLVDGFNQQSLNYASPAIIRDWGLRPGAMAPVLSINIFGWMLGSIAFSMLADRIGRRKSVLLAVFIFAVFTIALSFASNLIELSIIRFISALGVGGGMPMAISLVADYSQQKSRGLKITLLYLGYTMGSSGGGFLAAALTPNYGWQSVFLAGGITSFVIGVVLLFALPESVKYLVLNKGSQSRILAYAKQLRPSVAFDPDTRFYIAETAKKGVPVQYLFTEGRAAMTFLLWLALGSSFVTHFFLSGYIAILLSSYSGHTDNASVSAAQTTLSFFQMGAGFAWFFGWLLDKRGISIITWTMLLGALPVAALGFFDYGTYPAMAVALIAGILVLSGGIALNAVSGMVYPTFIRATGTGSAFAAARIGAILGPLLAGALVDMKLPISTILLIGALPMLAAGAFTFMLERSMTPESAREMASRSALARH